MIPLMRIVNPLFSWPTFSVSIRRKEKVAISNIRRGVGPRESLSPLIILNTTGRTGRAYRKAGNLKLI
jgi:hypothetical protein